MSYRPSDYVDAATPKSPKNSKVASPDIGFKGTLRWFWRQLTSMKVALILLLMLAVATIPGSLFPQRSADPNGVRLWQEENPELFKILDSFPIQIFDVYGSVWFSAIYLLLFISLIGCVLPRIGHHAKALRGDPPKTPARLERMVGFIESRAANPDATAEQKAEFQTHAINVAKDELKRLGYRAKIESGTQRATQRATQQGAQPGTQRGGVWQAVTAERGYARETGNLVFHLGLLGVLVAVAINGGLNFHGQRVLVEGEAGMVNALIDYDSATSGQYFDSNELEPWGLRLEKLEVDYVEPDTENQRAVGQVLQHRAYVTVLPVNGEPEAEMVRVNHPLRTQGASIYLLANGYAPVLTVRDANGRVVFDEAVPFIPQDSNLTSLGVVKVPDGLGTQLGFRGFFYPTQFELETGAYASGYPDLENPVLTLDAFIGDLGINHGVPQSVYALDTTNMTQITGRAIGKESIELRPGETVDLPDGLGSVTLSEIPRYVSFDVVNNPAQNWILVFALIASAGLLSSLFIPRRRMWVKALITDTGVTLQYAGLARGDDPTLERAVEALKEAHEAKL